MSNEDSKGRVKSRRRVPGLVPICDSRKKKLPELKGASKPSWLK